MRRALKIAILDADQTQRRMAREAGLSEARLSDILNEWVDPRPEECEKLAAVLGKKVGELFPVVEQPPAA